MEYEKQEVEPSQQICWSYVAQKEHSTVIYWATSISIIIFNMFFYILTPYYVQSIGMNLKADETRLNINTITFCLVTDFILLPLVIGMNLSEYTVFGQEDLFEDILKFLGIKYGHNTDFGKNWYPDAGAAMMMPMIIFSIQPIIDFLTEYLTVCICRRMAKKKWDKANKEQSASVKTDFMSKYIGCHAGPPYLYYYQSANVNCMTIVCLSMGPLLPFLYIIALYSLCLHYIIDRLTIAFFFRQPSNLSPKLT